MANTSGVKLVGADKSGGQLMSITLQLLNQNEIKIFRSLVSGETESFCPKCQDPFTHADTYYLRIDNPLAPGGMLGMEVATPQIKCDHCGEVINLSMVDYTPFKSAFQFVQNLRNEYRKRLNKNKG